VRGRQQAHVDRLLAHRAHRAAPIASWIERSSLDCIDSGRSPISSRNSVAAVGGLEEAFAVSGRPGERALR
jgi:hypothetical protein